MLPLSLSAKMVIILIGVFPYIYLSTTKKNGRKTWKNRLFPSSEKAGISFSVLFLHCVEHKSVDMFQIYKCHPTCITHRRPIFVELSNNGESSGPWRKMSKYCIYYIETNKQVLTSFSFLIDASRHDCIPYPHIILHQNLSNEHKFLSFVISNLAQTGSHVKFIVIRVFECWHIRFVFQFHSIRLFISTSEPTKFISHSCNTRTVSWPQHCYSF